MSFTTREQEKITVITALLQGKITNGEAAKKLGLSIRQIQRVKIEVKKHGILAVIHKLKGKSSNHKLNQTIKTKALSLVKEKYVDFHPTLASEKLEEHHQLSINPETLRLWMIQDGLWKVRKQKGIDYHSWRERKEYFGQLIQFDGSYHLWFEHRLLDEYGNPQEVCLLASIDDATGKITHTLFDFTIQFKNHFYQLEEIQPVTLRPRERVLVEEWLNKTIHFKFRGKYLKAFILPEKPRRVSKQPAILTTHPLNWKPPPNHPWRRYKNKTLP